MRCVHTRSGLLTGMAAAGFVGLTGCAGLGLTSGEPGQPAGAGRHFEVASSMPVPHAATPMRQRDVERALLAAVRQDLAPLLPALGWDGPAGRAMVDRVLAAAFSERLRIARDPADRQFLDLREGDAGAARTVRRWFERVHALATSRQFGDKGGFWPETNGVVGELPDGPLLRLAIALQSDWLGSWMLDLGTAKGTMDGPPGDAAHADRAARTEACRQRAAELIAGSLAGAAADPRCAGERVRLIGLLITWLDLRELDGPTFARAADLYDARPDADPWIGALFRGVVELDRARRARGDGPFAAVPPERAGSFQAGLNDAYASLARAHRLAPHRPEAASLLVHQALGTTDPGHETQEYWFQLATAADPTWCHAYRSLLYGTLDRWGGDDRRRLSLLRRLRAAADLEGGAPAAMLAPVLMNMAAQDESGVLSNRMFIDGVIDCLRAAAARAGEVDPDEAWSLAAVAARRARRADVLWSLFDEPHRRYVRSDLEGLDLPYESIERWALVRHPTLGAAFAAAESALERGDMAEAGRRASEVAMAAERSPSLRSAAEGIAAVAGLESRLAEGESVDLAQPALRSGWSGSPARLERAFDGGPGVLLSRVDLPSGDAGRLSFALPLRGRYRLEMDLEFTGPSAPMQGEARAWLRIAEPARAGEAPRGVVFMIGRSTVQVMGAPGASRSKAGRPMGLKSPPRTLVIDVDGARAVVLVDGRVWDVIGEAPPPAGSGRPAAPGNIAGRLHLENVTLGTEASLRFASIRLSRPVAPLEHATIAPEP